MFATLLKLILLLRILLSKFNGQLNYRSDRKLQRFLLRIKTVIAAYMFVEVFPSYIFL